jgi:hypothetical protein
MVNSSRTFLPNFFCLRKVIIGRPMMIVTANASAARESETAMFSSGSEGIT